MKSTMRAALLWLILVEVCRPPAASPVEASPLVCKRSPIVGKRDPAARGCKSDADCPKGKAARCVLFDGDGPDPENVCVYHRCHAHEDCEAGHACECGVAIARDERPEAVPFQARAQAHRCVPSTCRTDKDCPSSSCAPSRSIQCGRVDGYFCRTPRDSCTSDAQCDSLRKQDRCIYDGGRWSCRTPAACK